MYRSTVRSGVGAAFSFAIFALGVVGVGCHSSSDGGGGPANTSPIVADTSCVTTTAGPAGAVLRHPAGGTFAIPLGALATDTSFSLCGISDVDPAGFTGTKLGQGYRIKGPTASLLRPADLSLPFDATRLPPGALLDHARIETWSGTGSITLQSSADLTSGLARTQIIQFGDFAPSFQTNAVFITTPSTLPRGVVGTAYASTLAASGGASPYVWTLAPGSALPPGLTLDSAGILSGTPSVPTAFAFSIVATDVVPTSVEETFFLEVDPANAAAPVLAAMAPNGASQGASATTLLVTGTGFVPTSYVAWDGTAIATTFVGDMSLGASIPASDLTSTGSHAVTVVTPAPGGGVSASLPFTVGAVAQNPVPILTAVSPTTLAVSSTDTQIDVTGTSFVASTVVTLAGTPIATQFVSATELQAIVPAANLASAGTLTIGVQTPPPGGGASATTVSITVGVPNPAPTLVSLAPTSTTAGSAAFTLTVTGTGFVSGATIFFGSTALATTVVGATEATGSVPPGLVAQAGAAQLTVVNPAPGGGASAGITFTIAAVADGGGPSDGGESDAGTLDGGAGAPGDGGTLPSFAIFHLVGDTLDSDQLEQSDACLFVHVAPGSTLPAGLVIGAQGFLLGTLPAVGRYSFDILCEDFETPPNVARETVYLIVSAGPDTKDPTITSVTESASADGGAAVDIVGGTFFWDTIVYFDNVKLPYDPTMYVSATELRAAVPTGHETAGPHYVYISNVSDNVFAPQSNTASYTVVGANPVPIVDYVDPPLVAAVGDGGGTFPSPNFVLHGSGLGSASVVTVSGGTAPRTFSFSERPIGYGTDLPVPFDPSELDTPQTISVSVTNPAPGGGTSATRTIQIVASLPAPTLSGLVPSSFSSQQQEIHFAVASSNFYSNEESACYLDYGSDTRGIIAGVDDGLTYPTPPVTPTTLDGRLGGDNGIACGSYYLVANCLGQTSAHVPFTVTCDDLASSVDAGAGDAGGAVTAIAAGPGYTCALNGSGTVSCWGDGAYTGTGTSSPTPATQALASPAAQIGGGAQPCALLNPAANSSYSPVWCWGGTAGAAPKSVYAFGNVTDRLSGSLYTTNADAQKAAGYVQWQGSALLTLPSVAVADEMRITASGAFCARYFERVSCWGANGSGELGGGTTGGAVSVMPADIIPGVYDAWGLAASNRSMCVLHRTGGVSCWGDDTYGELGDGHDSAADAGSRSVPTPVAIAGLTDAIAIAGAGDHFCALRVSGTVVCWGYNADGALGDGTTTERDVPTPVPGLTNVTALALGAHHSCALRPGEVDCWGLNGSGEVGVPVTGSPVLAPTRAISF